MSGDWHVSGDLVERYVSGRIQPAGAMSVEAHLDHCGRCRAMLPTDEAWLAASWDQIVQLVVQPRLTVLERLLRRCGLPEHLARLLAATPTLSRAWLTAVVAVLAFAVVAAHAAHQATSALLPFLLVAPVLPLVGIAVAYGPRIDPAYELLTAAPAAGPRLLLLRAGAVLVSALAPAALATSLLPGSVLLGAAWLLPALAQTAACLALSTRMPVQLAAGGLSAGWTVTVLSIGWFGGDRMLAFHPVAQLAYGAAAVALAVVVFVRRRHLDPGEPRWTSPSAFVR
jgi:hypothetical protein